MLKPDSKTGELLYSTLIEFQELDVSSGKT